MKISRPVAFATGAVMTLVLGTGTAVAATGGSFILGKSNAATATTKLSNSKGTALALTSKAGTAPLTVSSSTKVGNLNADRLDGVDSTSFALAGGQTNTIVGGAQLIDYDNDGTADTVAAFATCPAGTRLTGGGADDYTTDGTSFINSPLDKTTWMVASTSTDLSAANLDNVVAYAQCYNPRGGITGGQFRVAGPSTKTLALAKQRIARKHG